MMNVLLIPLIILFYNIAIGLFLFQTQIGYYVRAKLRDSYCVVKIFILQLPLIFTMLLFSNDI